MLSGHLDVISTNNDQGEKQHAQTEFCGSAEDKMHCQKKDYCLGKCCHQTTKVVLKLGEGAHRIHSTSTGTKLHSIGSCSQSKAVPDFDEADVEHGAPMTAVGH